MATSPYFRHVTADNEQSLINDLTRETFYQRGLDLMYIPRQNSEDGFDYLFGEDTENFFTNAITIEMITENMSTGFDGAMSIGRFALELGDTATFTTSVTRFIEEISSVHPDIVRPREGDLIVFMTDPSEKKHIFEITFVEKETPFYQIGISNVFRMEAERFNYSHEDMQTGIPEIDDTPIMDTEYELDDTTNIQNESNTLVNFDEADPFSDNDY